MTLRDVARRAGVSVSTVSLVVNDKSGARIGEGTRQRVQQAVNELGYRTNALARSLVRGQSPFIGLVADAISTTPFAGKIIRGAQQEAWKQGYVLLVVDTDAVPEATDRAIQMMVDHRAHGILYSTWYHRDVEPPASLAGVPSVFVNCVAKTPDAFCVIPDEVQGGHSATDLLLAKGHRRVAFINSTESTPSTQGRLRGYKAALKAAGVAFDPRLVIKSFPEQEGGYEAASRLLALPKVPTAVFCYNDRVAMGLYDRLKEAGLTIPDDMAVVGFDDQEVIAAHLRPALTSIALPHYDIGALGVRTLLDRTGAASLTPGVQRVSCPPVVREST
ncbi:MAG: LacI family DNA-binding transcriptional regulator [Actinomycetota bacterium]|nr:LacI family DNA-binding transcriptional regulator [Actinomycetota bacterium]